MKNATKKKRKNDLRIHIRVTKEMVSQYVALKRTQNFNHLFRLLVKRTARQLPIAALLEMNKQDIINLNIEKQREQDLLDAKYAPMYDHLNKERRELQIDNVPTFISPNAKVIMTSDQEPCDNPDVKKILDLANEKAKNNL